MQSTIRIQIANAPEVINGVTWWRMFSPLMLLLRKYRDVQIRWNPEQLFPHNFIDADILFAYRPSNPDHPETLALARRLGCKILLDYDDNLLNVPLGHPTFKANIPSPDIVNQCVALADEVWTSTEHLKNTLQTANTQFTAKYQKVNQDYGAPNFTVIPNAVHPSEVPAHGNGNTKLAVWRGDWLHRDDLELWKEQYRKILRSVKTFLWAGYMPAWGKVDGPTEINYQTNFIATDLWLQYLRSMRPSLIWKPLISNDFNYSKSNISRLEATCAGAICLTNFAGTHPQWEYCTKDIPVVEEYYTTLWRKSADDVLQNYDLIQWNEIRYRQLLKLMNNG